MEGLEQKKKEKEEGGCKRQGVGTEKYQGLARVWSLGGLGLDWATLSQNIFYFLLQNNFAINFFKRRRTSR